MVSSPSVVVSMPVIYRPFRLHIEPEHVNGIRAQEVSQIHSLITTVTARTNTNLPNPFLSLLL